MVTLNFLTNKRIGDRKETINYTLFSIGQFISAFGTEIYAYAISLYVLRLTGSGLSFAAAYSLKIIPVILINPIAGVLADRFQKKKLVVMMNFLNGILFFLICIIAALYRLTLPIILISIFLSSAFTAIFNICMETAKPHIVSDNRLMNINAISRIISSGSIILGPVIGGFIFAVVNIEFFMMVNGMSFIISAIIEVFINFEYNVKVKLLKKKTEKIQVMQDIKEGIRYILSKKNIIQLFIIFVMINFCLTFSISVPLPFVIDQVLNLGSKALGIIQSGFPIGMIVGAIFIKKISERIPYEKLLNIMSFILAIGMLLVTLPIINITDKTGTLFYIIYYWITMFVLGGAVTCIDIPLFYILQKYIPDEIRGRVLSSGMGFVKIVVPIASMIAGLLLGVLPIYILPLTGGIVLCGFSILVLLRNKNESTNFKF